MISTRAPSRAPFTVAVEITSGPRTCSRATVGLRPRRSKPPSDPRRTEVQAGGDALAPPQRGVRMRHHRTAQERGMKAEWEANADAARRREPTVGQEAVSPRSRMRRLVRSQWFTPRHGRLNTACCLSAEGVATTKQRLDRAVGPAAAPCAQIPPRPQRFFNELKSHPRGTQSAQTGFGVLNDIMQVQPT